MTSPSDNRSVFLEASREKIRERRWGNRWAFINRRLPEAIADAVAACALPSGARVLDFGCADSPYRDLFVGCDYSGADLPGNPDADVEISDDGRLPLENDSMDLVLSSQVLEHVENPDLYLDECWRVLKPGGQLVLSTHGLMIYHRDPVDYWRWTGDGLGKIVSDKGFVVDRFEGVMGLAPTGLQLFQDATLAGLPRWLWVPYCTVFQLLITLFDKLHSAQSRRFNALVYIANGRKPASPSSH